jgi:hypothetical protein
MLSFTTTFYLACAALNVGSVQAEAAGHPDVSTSLQQILNKAHQGPLYTYPTSLTQGIIPVSLNRPLEFAHSMANHVS